jgi:hypothetical protein
MAWLQTTYTVRFNRRHRRSGHLFQGRLKAQVIDAAAALATKHPERPLQVWARARLGGEPRIDAARAYGYKDASAITCIFKKLESRRESNPPMAERCSRLAREFDTFLSSFKR